MFILLCSGLSPCFSLCNFANSKGKNVGSANQFGMGKRGRFVADLSQSRSASNSNNEALSASLRGLGDSESSETSKE